MLPCEVPAQYHQQQQQLLQQQQFGSARASSSQQDISVNSSGRLLINPPGAPALAAAAGDCNMFCGQQVQQSRNLSLESAGCLRVHSEDSAATTVQQPHNLMQQNAGSMLALAGAADVRAAVEAVAPGSTAWAAATELIKLQGQEPTIPLVTLVAARLLAQQRQQQEDTLHLLGGSSSSGGGQQQCQIPASINSSGGRLLLGVAAGAGRTAAGAMTRFCKRGSVFNAKPAAQRGVLSSVGRPGDAAAAADGRAAAHQHGRAKGRTTCQVAGCMMDLPSGKDTYNGRYRVCVQHMMVSCATVRVSLDECS
jgi:hypothetical protein